VLDVMMPGLDGLTVARVLRGESEIPILMLTARAGEQDLLAGLDGGADDYLTKPYSPRELTARARALLRRSRGRTGETILTVGALVVDVNRHQVHVDGSPVSCTPDEFTILATLAEQPDRVFTRAQLLERTNGFDRDLAAKRATESAFSVLMLGLAAVALLVGVANTMVISVLERRSEIGLRRSLGSSRGQIRAQFLTEATALSVLGGATGVALGLLLTAGYAARQGWPLVVPLPALLAGLTGSVLVGVLAGVYPSMHAARLTPTEALAS
jgi:CheY-like chemotaxis protein